MYTRWPNRWTSLSRVKFRKVGSRWAIRPGGKRSRRKRERNSRCQSFAPIAGTNRELADQDPTNCTGSRAVSRSEGTSHRIREKCSRGVPCTPATTKFSVNLLETPTGLDLSTISDTRSFFLRFIPPPPPYPLRFPLSNDLSPFAPRPFLFPSTPYRLFPPDS